MTQAIESARRSFEWERRQGLLRLAADLVRYSVASAAALALDCGLLLFCSKILGFHYLIAAAIGFLAGMSLIYLLSIRYVFSDRRYSPPAGEFLGFFVIGLTGLGLNEFLIHAFVARAGLSLALAKISTAALVFIFNFSARRVLLFSGPIVKGNDTCVH
jgi:putative flippase GtrA